MLHRVKQDDDAIEAIHVYGASGQILHSTGESGNQSVQPTVLAAGSGQDGNDIWHLEDKKHFLVGGTITDGSGQAVGGVAIAYSKENAITQVRAMSARLAFYCVLGLLVALLLSLPVLQFALRRHVGLFDALLQSYDFIQGYYFSRPVAAREIPDLARTDFLAGAGRGGDANCTYPCARSRYWGVQFSSGSLGAELRRRETAACQYRRRHP